jgi:hypothetical protein
MVRSVGAHAHCAALHCAALCNTAQRMRTVKPSCNLTSVVRLRHILWFAQEIHSMSPIQWRRPSRRNAGPRFVTFPPNQILTFLQQPSQYAVLLLHWQDERRQSFPCMGDGNCLLCPSARKVHVYTGVLIWHISRKEWQPAICDLGHPDAEVAQADLTGRPVVLGRTRNSDPRSPIKCFGQSVNPGLPTPPTNRPFDVRPHLLRRWGLFEEADQMVLVNPGAGWYGQSSTLAMTQNQSIPQQPQQPQGPFSTHQEIDEMVRRLADMNTWIEDVAKQEGLAALPSKPLCHIQQLSKQLADAIRRATLPPCEEPFPGTNGQG